MTGRRAQEVTNELLRRSLTTREYLAKFHSAKRDGKRQLWSLNLCFWGLTKRNLHSKIPNLSDISQFIAYGKGGSASFLRVIASTDCIFKISMKVIDYGDKGAIKKTEPLLTLPFSPTNKGRTGSWTYPCSFLNRVVSQIQKVHV
jgi:hypothetical protein